MSLDQPASSQALWAIYDATGVRPEYILPMLHLESGFNPGIVNSIGCVGINQECFALNGMTEPAGYASWSASQQLMTMVLSRYRATVAKFGPLNSGGRVYLANYLPAKLATATKLTDIVATKGTPNYDQNAGLDFNKDGYITLGDLAAIINQQAALPVVQAAIAAAYQLRPNEVMQNSGFGTDFPGGAGGPGLSGAIAGLNATDWLLLAGTGIISAVALAAVLFPEQAHRLKNRLL